MSGLSQVARGLRNIWGHGDEDDYGHDEVDAPEDAAPSASAPAPQRGTNGHGNSGYAGYSSSAAHAPSYGGGSGGTGGTSAARRLRPVASPLRSSREKNIYTLKPKSQDDAAIAADYLKDGTAVIINLEDVDRLNAVRIIDFMSGVCYGLEGQGHAMKLGETIFLYTPPEFDISSDETNYGANPDFFFRDITPRPVTPGVPTPSAPGAPPMNASAMSAAANPAPPATSYQAGERRSWER